MDYLKRADIRTPGRPICTSRHHVYYPDRHFVCARLGAGKGAVDGCAHRLHAGDGY